MTCDHFREQISADVDGELAADEQTALRLHLDGCVACSRYNDDVWSLRRSLRVMPVVASEQPLPTVDVAGPLTNVSAMRWLLFVIGATLVVLNGSALFTDTSIEAHLGRHDAVFGTALGIGMLAVAIKPHRAIGLVPLTSTIALLMVAVAVVDLTSSQATIQNEAIHVVEFAGLVCLWVISGGPARLNDHVDTATARLRRGAAPGSVRTAE